MEAVKIKLTGEMADHYDIYYRAQVEELGWLDWVKDGKKPGLQARDTDWNPWRLNLCRRQKDKRSIRNRRDAEVICHELQRFSALKVIKMLLL